MTTIRKAIAQILTGLVTWSTAVTVSEPARITSSEWVVLLGAAIGAFLVWLVPNETPGPFELNDRGQTNRLAIGLLCVALILLILWLVGMPVRIGN